MTFTSDGQFAVAGTSLGVTPVFDTSTGDYVRTLATGGSFGLPGCVAASPVGSLLAVAVNTSSGNGRVEIWNTRTWREAYVLTSGPDEQVSAIAFSRDGTRLAVAQENGSASVWSLQSRTEIVSLLGQTAAITSIEFSSDGREVATASVNGGARIWRARGAELDDFFLDGVESVALSTKHVVVAFLAGKHVEVSDWLLTGHEIGHFLIRESAADAIVSVSPTGRLVAAVANAPCPVGVSCRVPLQTFDVETGRRLGFYPVEGAESMTWSEDGREIAVASTNLQVVSLATRRVLVLPTTGAEQCGEDGAPAFSADGTLVAWASRCGNAAVFRVNGGPPVASFFVQGRPSGVAFNPAATQLAVSSWNGAVVVWNPRTGRREFSLPPASSGVSSVVYSPDGRYLLTTLLTEETQVWDARNSQHQLLRVDQDEARIIAAPAFDAEGSYFATADSAGAVKIWATCPACEDSSLLIQLARDKVVSHLTPLEQAATR